MSKSKPEHIAGATVTIKKTPFPHLITEGGERLDIRHIRAMFVDVGAAPNENGEVYFIIRADVAESEEADPESHELLTGTATPERIAELFGDLYLVSHLYEYNRGTLWGTPPDVRAEDIRDDKAGALAAIDITDVERLRNIYVAGFHVKQAETMTEKALVSVRETIAAHR